MSSSAVDLLLSVDDVEEAVLLVSEALVDLADGGVVLHEVGALREEHDALLLFSVQLQLLLDDGEHLADLEGVRHQEPRGG